MKYDEWFAKYKDKKPHGYLRIGQMMFNDLPPNISERIRGTYYDPFFCDTLDDDRMKDFLSFMKEELGE